MKLPDRRKHNHIKRSNRMLREGRLPVKPGVLRITIRHADRCAFWSGGACNCEPEILPANWEDARHD